jgi:hypothetical protein
MYRATIRHQQGVIAQPRFDPQLGKLHTPGRAVSPQEKAAKESALAKPKARLEKARAALRKAQSAFDKANKAHEDAKKAYTRKLRGERALSRLAARGW